MTVINDGPAILSERAPYSGRTVDLLTEIVIYIVIWLWAQNDGWHQGGLTDWLTDCRPWREFDF
jgi:hypothetical protein